MVVFIVFLDIGYGSQVEEVFSTRIEAEKYISFHDWERLGHYTIVERKVYTSLQECLNPS